MIDLLLLAGTCSVFMEDWSYVESLYAWFTTFTTIAFGDYIHLDSLGSLRSDDGNVNGNATNQLFDWLNEEK